jgi:dipeptidyl aminopeptidase/acylaminoacyl peptidase
MNFVKNFLAIIVIVNMNIFAQLPPLIDREIFFGDPEISGAQISPDGKYISFLKPFNNVRNVWVKKFDEPFENARPLTADTKRPITGYFWTWDSKFILYVQDNGGDENFRVYAVDPSAKGDPVPPARDLTPYENVRAVIIDVPKKYPDIIYVGLNDRNPQLHDVYKINLKDGKRELIWQNNQNIIGWFFDLDGNLRLAIRMTEDGGSEILKIHGKELIPIYSVTSEEEAYPVRFTPDGNKFYFVSNKGAELDKTQLMLYDLTTNKIEFIEKDPLDEVDFGGAYFSEITNQLVFTTYEGDKTRIYFRDEKFKKDYEKLKEKFGDNEITLRSSTKDEKIFLVTVSSDVDQGSVYVFNRENGEINFLYKSNPKLPSEHLAPMTPVRYTARDGMVIPAYLTLPKGITPRNLPTVLLVHGGPWARDSWGYDALAQFLANRGYAVLQPNFRGSTGFGKKFLNAGNKQWGRGSMQHDLTDAVKWLIDNGYSDPKRIAIVGGSYGGYATLAGLAFTPDIYAAGFSIVGPSSIITLLNSIPPYWAPLKKMFDVRVGDMNNPEERKMLEYQSPLYYATEIKKPLFVVQGANDPRVKKAESDQIVVALRDLGREVEYMVAEDEGHGFAGLENRIAMIYALENFLAKHLKGRYQEDLRKEIKDRYDKLMVDINTVTLPKKEENVSNIITSFNGDNVFLGKSKYSIKIEFGAQKMNMELNRDVSEVELNGRKVLLIIEDTKGMMAGTDSLFLDRKTLLPIKRTVRGMANIDISFLDKKVEGMIAAGPQQIPVNVEIESPVLSDGTGTDLAVSSLELKEGYNFKINQFDIQAGKPKSVIVKMIGDEKIEVSGKSISAFKMELKPEDDQGSSTIWIDKQTRKLIKSELNLPATMGGGKVYYEIVE